RRATAGRFRETLGPLERLWPGRCAGIVALVVVTTFGPAASAKGKPSAKQEAIDRATEHFLKGEDAVREKRYDDAMTEFGAGYAALPRPGFLLEMGLVQRQLGNLPRARGYY